MSKPPLILLLLVFITTLPIQNSLPIKEIKQIPNPLTLAPNERVRLYTEDYFTGFNLTFSSSSSGPKLSQIRDLALSSTAKLISVKTDLIQNGSLLGLLYDDRSVIVYKYSKGTFGDPIKVPVTGSKKCYDLEFLGQETVVVDCDSDLSGGDQKALYFINITQKKVTTAALIQVKLNQHTSRRLTNARHYDYAHLILFISSTDTKDPRDWQINYIRLTPEYRIASVKQVTQTNSLLPNSFLLYDVKAFTNLDLALGGNNVIYWLHNNNNNQPEIKKYPINGPAYSFNSLYDTQFLTSAVITSGTTAIEVLQGQDHGFLDVHNLFIDTVYSVTDRRSEKPAKVKFSQITKDFTVVITEGINPSIYIYRRGDPKDSEVFYFNYINKASFPFEMPTKILTQPEDNIIFWITETKVYALQIQEVWIEIVNSEAAGKSRNAYLKICSQSDCLDKNIQLNLLDPTDYSIHKANIPELRLVKPWNKTLTINVDDFFLGPHLEFSFIPEGSDPIATGFHPIKLSLGNLDFSFLGIHYDAAHDHFRLYHQTPTSPGLDLYICNLTHTEPEVINSKLECERRNSTGALGKVKKIHSRMPGHDIIEAVNDHGQREAFMASKNIFSSVIKLHADAPSCDVYHQSYDNKAESNLFCGHGNNISVVSNSSWINFDHIILSEGFHIRKILTHPAYPGLLFISNNTNIFIVSSEFYLGEHYGFEMATINSFSVPDPEFNFVVTSSHLVIFLPRNNSISEFDLSNPKETVFNKQYMLYGLKLAFQETSLAYSFNTDLIYFIGVYDESMHFVAVLEPNAYGNGNLRYVYSTGNALDTFSYSIGVTPYRDGQDFLLHGCQGFTQGIIVSKQHQISISGNYIPDKKLFAQQSFKLQAKSPNSGEIQTIPGTLTMVNTHRVVSPLQEDGDAKLTLSFGNMELSQLTFGGPDFFEGPVYRYYLTKPYKNDNIDLRPRVNEPRNPLKTTLPEAISDIAFKSGEVGANHLILVLAEGEKFVSVYNSSTFPLNNYTTDRLPIRGTGGNSEFFCYQVELGDKELYAGTLCYDYESSSAIIDIASMKDHSLQTYITAPNEDVFALYKVISNYVIYVSRTGYFAVYIYKINRDQNSLTTKLIKVLNRDDINIRKGDSITDLDGREIDQGQIGILLVTGATGLNYIHLKDETVKVKVYPDFISLFSSEHMDAYNNLPEFNAVSIVDHTYKPENDLITYTFVISSENAFAYRLQLSVDRKANSAEAKVIEGYIQYQGYKWKEVVGVSKDIVVLVGETEYDPHTMSFPAPLHHYFFYDRRNAKHTTGQKYPLFDAFQVITQNSENQRPLVMITRRDEKERVYLRDPTQGSGRASGLKECNIDDSFSIETYASRVTSSYVNLIAGNDIWNATIKVYVRSHGSLFTDVSPVKLILYVFGGLSILFILAAVVLRVFANKEKKMLKDNFVRFKDEGGETDPSQYFKIGGDN